MSVSVHDLAGRRIGVFDLGHVAPGRREVALDRNENGMFATAGVYFCRLSINGVPTYERRVTVLP